MPDLLLVRGGTIEWRLSTPVAKVELESGEALSTGVPNPLPWERQGPPEVSLRVGQLLRILRPGQPDTLDAVVGTIGDCWVGFPVDRTAHTPTAFSPLDPELFEEASVRISSEAVAEWPTEETAWSSLTWTELPHDQVRDFATCRP